MRHATPQVYKTPHWRKPQAAPVVREGMSAKMRHVLYQYNNEIRAGIAHQTVEAEMMRNCAASLPQRITT